MQKKTNLTALILARNESETLARTLQSLEWCEHCIVGDDGSSDDTIAIAKAVQVDVIKIPPHLSGFDQKRNYLTHYAPTDWILWIDADEVVSPKLRHSIEATLSSDAAETVSGWMIQRLDVFMGRTLQHGETAHTWICRLVKKTAGKWKRSVHEEWLSDGEIRTVSGPLLHYSHPNLDEFLEKINRYTELEANHRVDTSSNNTKLLLFSYVQLWLYPSAKFIQNYVVRLGFLDGVSGFIMAYWMSLHSLCVRIKVLEKLQRHA